MRSRIKKGGHILHDPTAAQSGNNAREQYDFQPSVCLNFITMKSTYLIIGYGLGLASSLVLHPRDATGTGAIAPGCATGVHMIIARAATESPGPGMIGSVANKIKNSVKGSDIESVDYPATPEPNWVSSEAAGVAAMTKLITAYTAKCPDSKLVLMGYSQVGDAYSPGIFSNFLSW